MPHSSNSYRILVIDDNPAIAEDFRKILCPDSDDGEALDRAAAAIFEGGSSATSKMDSYIVDSANQGAEGLDKLRQAAAEGEPYAMVFVDIRMPPGWDGVETTTHIWREFPGLQVVICTAYSDYSWEETVSRLGQSDRLFILKKPFDISEVRQLVLAITKRSQAEAEAREARQMAEKLNQAQAEALCNSTKSLQALRESEARMRAVVDNASEGIVVIDEQGTVESFNPAAEEIFGYSAEEMRGESIAMLMQPETGRKHEEIFGKLAADKDQPLDPLTREVRGRRKNGDEVTLLVGLSEVRLGDRRLFTALVRNISERKRAERELKGYAEALESANRALEEACDAAEEASLAKSHFLANMSHELRTPLHGILSFAEFGTGKSDTADREQLFDYFAKIDRSGKILLALVDDLLDLSRLEAGKLNYDFTPLDVWELTSLVADEFGPTMAYRKIELVNPRTDVDTSLVGDATRLMQVIRNLLSNAVNFSPDESTIEIETVRTQDNLRVSVLDRGVGIPEGELETIFDKFAQSSKTRSGAGGTGLGLAICEEIVSSHKGRIWAENRPGGGASLTFELPLDVQSATLSETSGAAVENR